MSTDSEPSFKSVVKVFCSSTRPDFKQPWSKRGQTQSTSSGFIVEQNGRSLILTNAHSVADATMVQVRKHGQATKHIARVLCVSHCSDVAVLAVEGPDAVAFFRPASEDPASTSTGKGKKGKQAEPMCLQLENELPALQEPVTVVGYPVGGDQLSVTVGYLSRWSHGAYAHSGRELLYAQVSAAINSGNSGGPVLSSRTGRVIGIAFQSLEGAENTGYFIPVPVIKHVLAELALTGKCEDFPCLSFYFQDLQSKHLKRFLGLPAGVTGVRVSRLVPTGQVARDGLLKVDDVVTHCEGKAIADDGTTDLRGGDERLRFTAMLMEKMPGDSVSIRLMRQGVPVDLTLRMEVVPPYVPTTLYDTKPSYIVWAGFVFVQLSQPYLERVYGREWEMRAPVKLLNLLFHGEPSADVQAPLSHAVPGYGPQAAVIIADVLQHEINAGYDADDYKSDVLQWLHTPDGRKVKATSLAVVAEELKRATTSAPTHAESSAPAAASNSHSQSMRFELTENRMVVLPLGAADNATAEICQQHAISHRLSEDLRTLLVPATSSSSDTASHAAADVSHPGKKRKALLAQVPESVPAAAGVSSHVDGEPTQATQASGGKKAKGSGSATASSQSAEDRSVTPAHAASTGSQRRKSDAPTASALTATGTRVVGPASQPVPLATKPRSHVERLLAMANGS